jgi:hypothetical protein
MIDALRNLMEILAHLPESYQQEAVQRIQPIVEELDERAWNRPLLIRARLPSSRRSRPSWSVSEPLGRLFHSKKSWVMMNELACRQVVLASLQRPAN